MFTLTGSLSTYLFTLRRAVFTFVVTLDVYVNIGVDMTGNFTQT